MRSVPSRGGTDLITFVDFYEQSSQTTGHDPRKTHEVIFETYEVLTGEAQCVEANLYIADHHLAHRVLSHSS